MGTGPGTSRVAERDSQARVQVGQQVDKGQPVSQSLFTLAGPLGHGDGPGEQHPMHSVPGRVAASERDSQAWVQVRQQVDKGQPVSQSPGALGHRDHGAAGYDGIQVQVHLRVSQSLLWAGPCKGRTGLDMLHSVPGGFKFTR